jgi:hypothetical protein
MVQELSQFWKGFDYPQKKLQIDPDQLQAILVFICSRLDYPQILTEIAFCESFLPKAVKRSTRFLYLEMLSAASTFLLQGAYKEAMAQDATF